MVGGRNIRAELDAGEQIRSVAKINWSDALGSPSVLLLIVTAKPWGERRHKERTPQVQTCNPLH